jgi:hypothetical protein
MKIANMAVVADATMPDCWIKHDHGTHVTLPLDVSQVSDAVVERVRLRVFVQHGDETPEDVATERNITRAALAALAAALGEVRDG